jgi:hypothetical protein
VGAGFALLLVNARHVKILPGRKTDVADAAWLARAAGARAAAGAASCRRRRSASCGTPARYRKQLIQAHTAETQRVHKTLEDAGIKLDSVAA